MTYHMRRKAKASIPPQVGGSMAPPASSRLARPRLFIAGAFCIYAHAAARGGMPGRSRQDFRFENRAATMRRKEARRRRAGRSGRSARKSKPLFLTRFRGLSRRSNPRKPGKRQNPRSEPVSDFRTLVLTWGFAFGCFSMHRKDAGGVLWKRRVRKRLVRCYLSSPSLVSLVFKSSSQIYGTTIRRRNPSKETKNQELSGLPDASPAKWPTMVIGMPTAASATEAFTFHSLRLLASALFLSSWLYFISMRFVLSFSMRTSLKATGSTRSFPPQYGQKLMRLSRSSSNPAPQAGQFILKKGAPSLIRIPLPWRDGDRLQEEQGRVGVVFAHFSSDSDVVPDVQPVRA